MMRNRTVIYLHETEPHASWVIMDKSQKIIQSVSHADLHTLSHTEDSDVYVFVPAQDILLTEAILPKLTRQRLLQALPFALEEQLIADVSELHFAIGEQQADGNLPVAVVSQQKMASWLNLLSDAKIAARALIPAIFVLPDIANQWQINIDGEHCIIRTGKFSGFACEKENLETLLELKLAEELDRQSIQLNRTHFSPSQLLEKITPTIDSLPNINLLQGAYHPKPQSAQIKKIWILASLLAIGWVATNVFGELVSFYMLNHQANKINTAINQIYHSNFPQSKSIVTPRERMTEKLHAVSGESNKNNVLAILGHLGKALAEARGIRILNLDYREQKMVLEVSAGAFDNIDTLTHLLTQQGLGIKQQNATTEGSQVKATLLISAGAA
jgi:general secretion pathway protein L